MPYEKQVSNSRIQVFLYSSIVEIFPPPRRKERTKFTKWPLPRPFHPLDFALTTMLGVYLCIHVSETLVLAYALWAISDSHH